MSCMLDQKSIKELVLMSIGTKKGSWFAEPLFGCEIHTIEKVDSNTSAIMQQMLVRATRWLVEDGLAADIDIEVERIARDSLLWRAIVMKPDGSTELVGDVWRA